MQKRPKNIFANETGSTILEYALLLGLLALVSLTGMSSVGENSRKTFVRVQQGMYFATYSGGTDGPIEPVLIPTSGGD